MKRIALALLAIIAVASCSKEPNGGDKAATLEITSTDFNIPVEGTEEFKVTFTTDADWTAKIKSSDVAAAAITPKSGKAGNKTITVIAEENDSKAVRTMVIEIAAGSVVKEVTLTQDCPEGIYLAELELNIPKEGGRFEIPVMSNGVQYTYKVSAEEDSYVEVPWLTPAAAPSAYESKPIVLVAEEYDVLDEYRYAYVTISAEGYEDIVCTLFQFGPQTKIWGHDLRDFITRKAKTTVVETEADCFLSIAIYGDEVLLCPGDGTDLLRFNKKTGQYLGTKAIEIEGFTVHTITNDDAGNLIMTNRNLLVGNWTDGWDWNATFKAYYLAPDATTPQELISGSQYGPAGHAIDVKGDVTSNALVLITHDDAAGFSYANSIEYWTIANGAVDAANSGKVKLTNFAGAGGDYANTWYNGVAGLLGNSLTDGALFFAYPENNLYMVPLPGNVVEGTVTSTLVSLNAVMPDSGNAWNFSTDKIRSKTIGANTYVAVLCDIHGPQWSGAASLKIFDKSTMAEFKTCATANYSYDWNAEAGGPDCGPVAVTGDVMMEAAEDGGINVYYVANNPAAFEAFHYTF